MKITKKNLSQDIVDTLDLVESIAGKPDKATTSRHDVITNIEISDICDIKNSKPYIKHSLKHVVTDSTDIMTKFPTNKVELDVNEQYNIKGNYRMFKQIKKMLIVLTEEGFLSVFKNNLNNPIFSMNIVKIISDNFNKIHVFDIDDIEIAGESILIATRIYGVFKMNNRGAVEELLIADNGISHLKYLGDNKLLCLYSTDVKNNVKIYTLDKGKYVQGYNHLKKETDQKPKDFYVEDDHFVVLGSPKENEGYNRTLHVWVKNSMGGYSNVDADVYPHTDNVNYHSKFVVTDGRFIYIIGEYKNKTFIWKWKKDALHMKHSEVFIDVDCKLIDNVYVKDNILTLDSDKTLYRYNLITEQIVSNFRFESIKNIEAFYEEDNKYYIFQKNYLTSFIIPKESKQNKFNITLEAFPFEYYKVVIKCLTPELIKLNVPSLNYGDMKFFTCSRREVQVSMGNSCKNIQFISIKGITEFSGGDLDE